MNISHVSNIRNTIALDSSSDSNDDNRPASSSNASCLSTHSLTNSDSSQSLFSENIASKLKVNKKEWTIIDVKDKQS
ncbi:unnamed protein product [Adineta steineri]|uniref:Uncharacterized protein n=1 Tax=Adineta steineri TaxID=433720 RepID=A0A819TMZ0_9BILA|nr:unnamed protein product [Adineta steineri]CAF4080933.1 unnamed protein product [Adineta steineri]